MVTRLIWPCCATSRRWPMNRRRSWTGYIKRLLAYRSMATRSACCPPPARCTPSTPRTRRPKSTTPARPRRCCGRPATGSCRPRTTMSRPSSTSPNCTTWCCGRCRAASMGDGIGEDIVAAYNWINQPLFTIDLPIHLPHPIKKAENALDGAIDSTVRDVLLATGLLSILQEVTGKPEPLAQAADVWLSQAHQAKAMADELRQAARPLPQSWQGAASAAFGDHMGQLVNALAATAVADIFTFGLATIAGGIAESAEMTAFVARAAQVSTKLAEVLDRLLEE